jgi:hypothetical protein
MQHENAIPRQHIGHIRSSPKEKVLPHIGGVRTLSGKSHSTPWLAFDTTSETWLAYLQKSTIIYDIHHHLSLPRGVHVFNATWTTLHMLRECIHVLRKRPQNIPRSPRPSCTVVTSPTTDTQPLPHDRDCTQANLILRGQVQDSHHSTGGYLPFRWCVIAEKQIAESKSLLACHLLRLL